MPQNTTHINEFRPTKNILIMYRKTFRKSSENPLDPNIDNKNVELVELKLKDQTKKM